MGSEAFAVSVSISPRSSIGWALDSKTARMPAGTMSTLKLTTVRCVGSGFARKFGHRRLDALANDATDRKRVALTLKTLSKG